MASDYYNKAEIKKLITYADRAERLLQSEGYAKREGNIGLGDYYYDRDEEYGGEFSFISNTRSPIRFTTSYDFDSSKTTFEIESNLLSNRSWKIVSPEEWINHLSEIVRLKTTEDKNMKERKSKYLAEQGKLNNAPTINQPEDNVLHFRRR